MAINSILSGSKKKPLCQLLDGTAGTDEISRYYQNSMKGRIHLLLMHLKQLYHLLVEIVDQVSSFRVGSLIAKGIPLINKGI